MEKYIIISLCLLSFNIGFIGEYYLKTYVTGIKSNKEIKPIINISIDDNGKTDTTFIYKK